MSVQKHALVHALLVAMAIGMPEPAFAAESTQSRQAAAFDAVNLSGAIDLMLAPPGPWALRLTGEQESLAKVVTEVKDGTLYIRQEDQRNRTFDFFAWLKRKQYKIKCEVTAPALKAVSTAGACSVEASGLMGESFKLEASGAANAKLAGKIKHLSLELSGAGTVDAEQLKAEEANLDLSGASDVVVNAANTLKVDASGACKVTYVGKPRVQKDLSGACSVRAK